MANLKFLCLYFLVIGFVQSGNAIRISTDGGYEVLLALEENTPAPTVGVARYIENIKVSLDAFSNQLWRSTKSQFYLKSVDLLLPSHWTVDSALSATTQSFQAADIRISPNVTYPHAENPNICGQPGNFIELPDSFFSVANSGPYGLHWKSLLHIWALYRWGVHSEHGYIADSKFPYAYKEQSNQQWAVTGCSDETVQGQFVDITNPENTCESANGISETCRFVPQAFGQTATSSLMHFHWIESVTEFCDEHNHNKNSPNKQNALCDHRSIWEIIRETPDYLAVTSPRNVSVPRSALRVMKHSATPLFYLLLDRGLVQGSYAIANKVPRLIATFVNGLRSTLGAIGAYPGSGNSPVTDLVDWSEIGTNVDVFVSAIGELRADGPLERDFSRALVAVADKIKQKNHPNGAVVLLVKYGADVQRFGGYLPESEVLNAFNEQNIIFNAIELNFPNHTGYSHLSGLAQATGGGYTVLQNYGEVENNVANVLSFVRKTLVTEYTDLKRNWKTLRKQALTSTVSVAVPADIKGTLQIYVSSANANISRDNFNLTGQNLTGLVTPRQLSFSLYRSLDWKEAGSKFTYLLTVPKSELTGFSQVDVKYACTTGTCSSSSVLARAEFSGETDQVKIDVLTSLQNGHADLSNGQPVSIFTKVTKNGLPVQGAIVMATLTDTITSRISSVYLIDDGEGSPDVQELDGIYSAYFAPEMDGQYKLSVTVEGNPSRNAITIPNKVFESSFTRLLPVDQGDFGCNGAGSCNAEIIQGTFSQTVELASTINVIQAALYTPAPTKVFTLMAFDRPDLGQGTLYWRSPNIPGRLQSVSSYELRSAPSRDLLITNFDNQTVVPVPPTFRPKPPASLEMIAIPRPTETTYYAVRSTFRGKQSKVSNVAEIMVQQTSTITPTETTTTDGGSTDPTGSTNPTNPTDPTGPTNPTDPTTPTPSNPTNPTTPNPTNPTSPNPSNPTSPNPTNPTSPNSTNPSSTDPTVSTTPGGSGSAERTKSGFAFGITLLFVMISFRQCMLN